MATVPSPKAEPVVIEPLTREEVAATLKACDGSRMARTRRRASFTMRRDCAVQDRAMVKRYAAIAETDLAKAHETGSPTDKWRP